MYNFQKKENSEKIFEIYINLIFFEHLISIQLYIFFVLLKLLQYLRIK
jgi:hypothetical protein